MNCIVTDRASIERGIVVRTAYVVISISDPGTRRPSIKKTAGLRDVLHLAFHDAEPTRALTLGEGIVLMTEDQARQAWEFVRAWRGRVGSIVVHCEQGMSRSPAMAAAICRAFGGDDRRFFREYQPNRHVFRLMSECGGLDPEIG
jgi:predicted protein tyrosine phosphatase